MTTKPWIAPPIASGYRRLEHADSWLAEDEAYTWTYVCPRVSTRGTVFVPMHARRIEADVLLAGFEDFVRWTFSIGHRQDRFSTLEQVTARYTELVRQIPEVKEVWLSEEPEGATLWTIIDAERFARGPRREVYGVQYEVLRAMNKPLVDFRLLNVADFQRTGREHVLPRTSRLLMENK
jgi:hypothetical protein